MTTRKVSLALSFEWFHKEAPASLDAAASALFVVTSFLDVNSYKADGRLPFLKIAFCGCSRKKKKKEKNRNRIHLSNVTVFRKLRYFFEKGFFKTKTRVESGKYVCLGGRITLCIAVGIAIATSIEQRIRTQDVVSDLGALRSDLLDASGIGNFNRNAWCDPACRNVYSMSALVYFHWYQSV